MPRSTARRHTYPVTADDVGKRLTVKVTSASVPGTVSATTQTVTTAAEAGLWEVSDCTEPTNVGGVYQITKETELHWFASEVNSGNTAISARLLNDLALTSGNLVSHRQNGPCVHRHVRRRRP